MHFILQQFIKIFIKILWKNRGISILFVTNILSKFFYFLEIFFILKFENTKHQK